MLHKLVFDTTDADSILDSANVGAWLRAGADGAFIDHQTIAASEWLQVVSATADGAGNLITSTGGALDVNLKSPITVDTDIKGIYNVSTNPTPDNVGLIVNTRGATPGATTQIERLTAGAASSNGVVAADVHALDTNSFGMLYNGTTWDRWQGTGGSANVNVTGGTITVSDAALANTAVATAASVLAVDNTAQAAVAAPLAARKYLWLFNNGKKNVFVGAAGVTPATGFPIPPGALMDMRAGAAVDINWVSALATGQDLRTMELS